MKMFEKRTKREEDTMKEQRKFVRHNVRHLLDFFTTDSKGNKTSSHMGRMLDLSLSGMKIETPVDLNVSTRLEITAGIADNIIDVVGMVTHTKQSANRYVSGIQLISISSEGRRLITSYIEKGLKDNQDEQQNVIIH